MPYGWLPCWRLSVRRERRRRRTLRQKRQQPGFVDARPPLLALADARSPLADVRSPPADVLPPVAAGALPLPDALCAGAVPLPPRAVGAAPLVAPACDPRVPRRHVSRLLLPVGTSGTRRPPLERPRRRRGICVAPR